MTVNAALHDWERDLDLEPRRRRDVIAVGRRDHRRARALGATAVDTPGAAGSRHAMIRPMTTMQAARLEDGALHIRDVPIPVPGDEEALIRISAVRGVPFGSPPRTRGLAGRPTLGDDRPRGDRGRRSTRPGRRPVRRRGRPGDPRARWHRWRLLVRRVRVLPPRAPPPLLAEQGDHRHVRRALHGLGTIPRALARHHRRSRGAPRVRRAHRVRRGEEAARPRGTTRVARSRSSARPAGSGTTPCRSRSPSATR